MSTTTIPTEYQGASLVALDQIEFVKDLYPRMREDEAAIEQYRTSLELLPPVVTARGRILVDGFHRWQAHRREKASEIWAIDLGNLSDGEIFKEAIRRNAKHGRQLKSKDKERDADLLYRQGTRDLGEIAELLSITKQTADKYVADAKRDERQAQKDEAWDRWLNCESYREIGKALDVAHTTIEDWCVVILNQFENTTPPESRQHFDVWNFQKASGDSAYFGKMPPQVVENLLWLYTEPGQIVFDPFAGGGTTIDIGKAMARRVWSSDLSPSTPNLPIHAHDITTGWPKDAPKKVDIVLLDPPYWQQAKEKYSELPEDLGNQELDEFMKSWRSIVKHCVDHLAPTGYLAFIISPSETDDGVVDHALEMWRVCADAGLKNHRRIIVPYQTQQATGAQVEWARSNRKLLKLYRDLVVMKP